MLHPWILIKSAFHQDIAMSIAAPHCSNQYHWQNPVRCCCNYFLPVSWIYYFPGWFQYEYLPDLAWQALHVWKHSLWRLSGSTALPGTMIEKLKNGKDVNWLCAKFFYVPTNQTTIFKARNVEGDKFKRSKVSEGKNCSLATSTKVIITE